jgi:SAM-dependent methyltransferase
VIATDPGSFRDPKSRVYLSGTRVLRGVRSSSSEVHALLTAGFFLDGLERGELIATSLITDPTELEELKIASEGVRWQAVMEHDHLPVISYPFEWSRTMLLDAAELELRTARKALADGWMTIDATPYNVQFVGSRPVHIDIGSFEPYRDGQAWIAYRQFCEMFLYPLLLGVRGNGSEHRVMLRGSLAGISASMCWTKLAALERLRPSLIVRVGLQAAVDKRRERGTRAFTHSDLAAAGMSAKVIDKQMGGLQKLLGRIDQRVKNSQWSSYSDRSHYSSEAFKAKRDFVVSVASSSRPSLVLDIGANDGAFSEAVAPFADYVVAVDSDDAVIDNLYSSLKGSGKNILPLVVDITDPAGGRGWGNTERQPFFQRVKPDLVLCLAVIHHLVISESIPPELVAELLRSLDADVVLEIPSLDDPMVGLLLEQKMNLKDYRDRYDGARITRALENRFEIRRRVQIGTRSILHLVPRI